MSPPQCQPMIEAFTRAWPPERWRETTVVAAVSGGADSVALLRLLAATAPDPRRLVVAHMNHQWREEAADDEQFVRLLAEGLGLRSVIRRGTPPPESSSGAEEAARGERYQFLLETAHQIGARYVLTAHTADDQAETVLHHVIRGTGLAGLAGMGRTRLLSPAVTLVRPLLEFRREELLQYLLHLRQDWRHDRTNDDTTFTRSRIRHELLPKLAEQFNPRVVESLARLGRLAGEAQEMILEAVQPLWQRTVSIAADGAANIDCTQLTPQPAYLVRELFIELWRQLQWPLQEMSFAHWDSLAELAQRKTPGPTAPLGSNRTGSVNLPAGIRAVRDGDHLLITPPHPPRSAG